MAEVWIDGEGGSRVENVTVAWQTFKCNLPSRDVTPSRRCLPHLYLSLSGDLPPFFYPYPFSSYPSHFTTKLLLPLLLPTLPFTVKFHCPPLLPSSFWLPFLSCYISSLLVMSVLASAPQSCRWWFISFSLSSSSSSSSLVI